MEESKQCTKKNGGILLNLIKSKKLYEQLTSIFLAIFTAFAIDLITALWFNSLKGMFVFGSLALCFLSITVLAISRLYYIKSLIEIASQEHKQSKRMKIMLADQFVLQQRMDKLIAMMNKKR